MLWSIILAGGEGQRTRPFVERWLGAHRPKQYCCFVGKRSMFQHTIDRADQLRAGAVQEGVVARPQEHIALDLAVILDPVVARAQADRADDGAGVDDAVVRRSDRLDRAREIGGAILNRQAVVRGQGSARAATDGPRIGQVEGRVVGPQRNRLFAGRFDHAGRTVDDRRRRATVPEDRQGGCNIGAGRVAIRRSTGARIRIDDRLSATIGADRAAIGDGDRLRPGRSPGLAAQPTRSPGRPGRCRRS